ncbi:MAG TPA: hypothetical protein VKH42_03005, partial [Vicinamibacterales bacterium]|nr:hypothetical protein [Vicinamibacterales bacterium]
MTTPSFEFPDGKRFAFTVIDDTDVATAANVAPVYRLFERLGMRATKTVWPLRCPEGSRDFAESDTLEDDSYRAFVLDLHRKGFEIASHGATMESSTRERTIAALERFKSTLGFYPRVHANHALNRENLYWGAGRIDSAVLKRLVRLFSDPQPDYYQGHRAQTDFFWGDLCARHVGYVRNLTFREINLLRVNPSMPYRDPSRPLVPWWFSATDAEDADAFCRLIDPAQQARLEREGGVCIVATHFGKGFTKDGRVIETFRDRLETLARRRGWFPTVGELLDWLRARRRSEVLPRAEWRRMQWMWARDLFIRAAPQLRFRARVIRNDVK